MDFDRITQVLGVGYTYNVSIALRRHLTKTSPAPHSSQTRDFTYFYKGDRGSLRSHGEPLCLRLDPVTNTLADHWSEPELAILLGEHHRIEAYTLANDFTAYSLEVLGRTAARDGTYEGKVWPGSAAIGPRFVSPAEIGNDGELTIGLRIFRSNRVEYDHTYTTSTRKRPFACVPDMIVGLATQFSDNPPPSKRVLLGQDGRLLPGTLIMLGSGLMATGRWAASIGDIVSVYSSRLGTLTNSIEGPTSI